jgi:predicted MFS family arabinose efflux permease
MANSRTDKTVLWIFGPEGKVIFQREMQIVLAMTAIGVSGIFVVSPIVSNLTGPFNISNAQAGQLITAFVGPSIVLAPVMGILADRVGRKPIIVGGLVIFGIAGVAVGLTTSFTVVLGLRAIQGIGYAAIIPIGTALLGDLYTRSREATAQGLRASSIQLTNIVSPPLAGGLVFLSWRFPFFLYALAFAVALMAWRVLPETDTEQLALGMYAQDLVDLISKPALATVLFSFVVRFGSIFMFLTYISVLLSRTINASAATTGFVVSLYALIALVTATQAGRVVVTWDSFVILSCGLLISSGGIALMGIVVVFPSIIVGSIIVGIGTGLSAPIQKSLVTQLAPQSLRAGAVSSAVIFQNVGSTAGPFLTGIALERLPITTTFVIFGVVGMVASAGILVVAWLFQFSDLQSVNARGQ